jgi:hypothetical protein
MAYVDIYDQATTVDSSLRKKIAVALHKAATDIAVEDPQTANHPQRLAWARRVISDPVGWSEKAVWTIMQNGVIAAAPTTAADNDVQFVVNSNIANFLRIS